MREAVYPCWSRELLGAGCLGDAPVHGRERPIAGLCRLGTELGAELDAVTDRCRGFRAARSDYGAGKTLSASWLNDSGTRHGFVVPNVQINEMETRPNRFEPGYWCSIGAKRRDAANVSRACDHRLVAVRSSPG